MFTGLIEQVGEVEGVRQTEAGRELRVRAPFNDLVAGEKLFFGRSFGAMKIFDYFALAELAFEWLDHFRDDFPIIISGNPVNYLGLADADMSDDPD